MLKKSYNKCLLADTGQARKLSKRNEWKDMNELNKNRWRGRKSWNSHIKRWKDRWKKVYKSWEEGNGSWYWGGQSTGNIMNLQYVRKELITGSVVNVIYQYYTKQHLIIVIKCTLY